MAKPARSSKTYSVREDLATRLEEEADARLLNPGLLIDKALVELFDFFDGAVARVATGVPVTTAPHPPTLEGKGA